MPTENDPSLTADAPRSGGSGTSRSPKKRRNTDKNPYETFQGNTARMNGHAFACPDELPSQKKHQFTYTIDKFKGCMGKTMCNPQDLQSITCKLEDVESTLPSNLLTVEKRIDDKVKTWEMEVKEVGKRTLQKKASIVVMCSVAWGQCAQLLQTKLKIPKDYDAKSLKKDVC